MKCLNLIHMQELNFKGLMSILFFWIKGLKLKFHKGSILLSDKKRTVFVSKMTNDDILSIKLKDKSVKFRNPKRKGFYKIKNYNPPLCVLIT